MSSVWSYIRSWNPWDTTWIEPYEDMAVPEGNKERLLALRDLVDLTKQQWPCAASAARDRISVIVGKLLSGLHPDLHPQLTDASKQDTFNDSVAGSFVGVRDYNLLLPSIRGAIETQLNKITSYKLDAHAKQVKAEGGYNTQLQIFREDILALEPCQYETFDLDTRIKELFLETFSEENQNKIYFAIGPTTLTDSTSRIGEGKARFEEDPRKQKDHFTMWKTAASPRKALNN